MEENLDWMEDLRTYATLVIPAAGRSSRFKSSTNIDKCLAPVVYYVDDKGDKLYRPLIVDTLSKIRSRNILIAKNNDRDVFIKDVFIIVNSENSKRIKDTIEKYKEYYIDSNGLEIHYFVVDNYDGDCAALYRLYKSKEFNPYGYTPSVVMWSDAYISDITGFGSFLRQSHHCLREHHTMCSIAAEICNYKDGVPYCIIKEWPEERSKHKKGTIGRVYGIDHASTRSEFTSKEYESYLNKRNLLFRKTNYLLHDLSVFYIDIPIFDWVVIDWIMCNGIQKDEKTGTYSKPLKFMDILNSESGRDYLDKRLLFNSLNGKFTKSFNTVKEFTDNVKSSIESDILKGVKL